MRQPEGSWLIKERAGRDDVRVTSVTPTMLCRLMTASASAYDARCHGSRRHGSRVISMRARVGRLT